MVISLSGQINCDINGFESKNEKTMMSHLSDEHEDCYTWYVTNTCAKNTLKQNSL